MKQHKKKPKPTEEQFTEAPVFTADQAVEQEANGKLVLPAGAPLDAADKFLKLRHSIGDTPLLWSYRGAFYLWTGRHYREHPEESLERDLYEFLGGALARAKNGDLGPFNPTKHKVQEIVHALRRSTLVPRHWEMPFWLRRSENKPAGELISCRNGILNLQTRELLPHDPLFFTTNCLAVDYDPKPPKPKRFRQFLEELWPTGKDGNRDEEAELTLLEIMGYLLTSDTRQQKIFLIVGPARAGKGTIVFLLEHLLGEDNMTYQTLNSLTGDFGRWPLIDKKLCVTTDARLESGGKAAGSITEHLLSISGGDSQTINRKNQEFWNGKLAVRFLITTNELPTIRDASGLIASRFILLKLTVSFLDKEDLTLQSTLVPELPGILNLALDGLDRLRGRGHFNMPKSSRESIRELEDLASPVRAFVREWCGTDPSWDVAVKELYDAYKTWADETGNKASPRHVFGKALRSLIPTLRTTGNGSKRKYVGIDLIEEGAKVWNALLEEKKRARR
jgi:putative DNA primase/helicase